MQSATLIALCLILACSAVQGQAAIKQAPAPAPAAISAQASQLEEFVTGFQGNSSRILAAWQAQGPDVCGWAGVSCSAGLLTGLSLPLSGLTGKQASKRSARAGCKSLTAVCWCAGGGTSWGPLPTLEVLDLSQNSLGNLPANIWQALPALQRLNVSNCQLVDYTIPTGA